MTILFFAAAREAAGTTSVTIELPDAGASAPDSSEPESSTTLGAALDAASASSPALRAVLPSCRTALDEEFAPRSARLHDGATIAVLPPLSGG